MARYPTSHFKPESSKAQRAGTQAPLAAGRQLTNFLRPAHSHFGDHSVL